MRVNGVSPDDVYALLVKIITRFFRNTRGNLYKISYQISNSRENQVTKVRYMTATSHRLLFGLETGLLATMLFGFWFSTPTRDQWLFLLAGIPVLLLLRWWVAGRPWPRSPLNGWMLALVGLGALNILFAPFNRDPGNLLYAYAVIFARVWLGIALVWWLIGLVEARGSLGCPLLVAGCLSAGLGLLALGVSAWTGKSSLFQPLINLLPRWGEALRPFEAASMNPNELAGALALLTPLMFGAAAWAGIRGRRGAGVILALVGGGLLLVAMVGQSRFALTGIFAALALLLPWALGRWWMRAGLWLCVAVLIVVQAGIILRPITSASNTVNNPDLLNERDQESWSQRLDIWSSALAITRAYPLTGAGANMFRDGRVRALFPAASFPGNAAPHAHNAWLQMSADMGVPGLLLYLGLQITLVWMLVRTWRQGDPAARAAALGMGGGLLAHAVYSLGDAVPLWDRLAFVYWLLTGLAAASYSLITKCPIGLENRDFSA